MGGRTRQHQLHDLVITLKKVQLLDTSKILYIFFLFWCINNFGGLYWIVVYRDIKEYGVSGLRILEV